MNQSKVLQIALVTVAVTILAVGLLALVMKSRPKNFLHSGSSPLHYIEMTLDQIDNAKALLATESHVSIGSVPTREQLQPYLKRGFWRGESHLGVEFQINAIGVPAEAVLQKRLDRPLSGSLPPKTIIRFSTNLNDYEVVQPSAALQRR